MQAFSAHHIQRGDVTAIVWGAPGEQYRGDEEGGTEAGTGVAGRDDGSSSMRPRVDAEELTRGRRAAMPFVQQCDLVFPLPVRRNRDDEQAGQEFRNQLEAERCAETFVAEALGIGFYYRVRGPLSALLRQPFLGEYVLKGGFSALALNAPSDQGNSFAVLPSGVLLLSLDRESFQTLGLPGEAAPTRPNGKSKRAGAGAGSTGGSDGVTGGGAGGCDRYVASFDLFSEAFRPGKRLHDRLLSCLAGKGGKERAVDMLICSWGDDLEGDETDVIKAPERSGFASQRPGGNTDTAAGEAEAAVGAESSGNREKDSQIDGKRKALGRQEGCCREISYPACFSEVDKIQLKPDVRFFREACCPDLDFVGQGLARARTDACAGTTAARNEEQPEEAIGRAQTAVETEVDRCPPRSTKCRLVLDLFEWLGAVSCGLEPLLRREPSPPDPLLSEFETPRHLRFKRHRTICRARLRGLLPPLMVSRCVEAARDAPTATDPLTHSAKYEDTGARREISHGSFGDPDGCSWGSVVAWPFRDAPRSYPGANAPCAGGVRTRRGGRAKGGRGDGGSGAGGDHPGREWPVGGQGIYAVVACPRETAAAFVSARCPGPGW